MKKILSLTLVLAMVMSMGITTAFAAGNWEGGTQVTYTATGAEEWTVTVPATLAPGAAGDVTAAGTWGSNRKLVVTADDSVKLTNSINSADYKDLDVTFADINLVGDNTQAVSETKQVSVAAMPADALFGTWSGTFYYDVEMVNVCLHQNGTYEDEYQDGCDSYVVVKCNHCSKVLDDYLVEAQAYCVYDGGECIECGLTPPSD